ncbi:MAG TPA: membrane protein insertion efficiency factor YidD [Thermoanaerobaculia bacterium]
MGRGKGRRARLVVLAAAVLIALQFIGAPVALYAIGEYRAHVSHHLTGIVQCRFTPTCSAYGQGVIQKYGFYIGTAKAIWRVARCGPWTKLGTVDPP